MGMGTQAVPGPDYTSTPRTFDDVFGLFGLGREEGGGGGAQRAITNTTPREFSQPTAAHVGNEGSMPQAATGDAGHAVASVPPDVIAHGELNMIMKIIQSTAGDIPTIELGGMAERPEHLRK